MSYCTNTSNGFLKFERRHDVPLFSYHGGMSVTFSENHTFLGPFFFQQEEQLMYEGGHPTFRRT